MSPNCAYGVPSDFVDNKLSAMLEQQQDSDADEDEDEDDVTQGLLSPRAGVHDDEFFSQVDSMDKQAKGVSKDQKRDDQNKIPRKDNSKEKKPKVHVVELDPEKLEEFAHLRNQLIDFNADLLIFIRCEMAARIYYALRELSRVNFSSSQYIGA